VYDFVGGKLDWLGHGLAYEGEGDLISRHLRSAPTCELDDLASDVIGRVGTAELCVVIDPSGIVQASVDAPRLREQRGSKISEIAHFGPKTVRPSEDRPKLDEWMHETHSTHVVVTTPEGKLLGLYWRST